MQQWSGVSPLQLTAFYGIREYSEGAWLRSHIDRIDTHVISVTIALAKLDPVKCTPPYPVCEVRHTVRTCGRHGVPPIGPPTVSYTEPPCRTPYLTRCHPP